MKAVNINDNQTIECYPGYDMTPYEAVQTQRE